jgi:hypothetical protein
MPTAHERCRSEPVLPLILEDVLPVLRWEIIESEDSIAVEPGALHAPLLLQLIGSDDGPAIATSEGDDPHIRV